MQSETRAHDAGSVHGLSTTVAHEQLVEEVELIVNEFLEHVKAVTWKSRLSFPQSHEGAVALVCIALFCIAAVYTLDVKIFAEVLLVLPFHFLAWYISFRLPRVEQLRAIAKVQECVQKFVANEDAFTCTMQTDGAAGHVHEVMPPSSFCVSVLRDRAWRQIPYNMLVTGDVFRLRDGEASPCRAERLIDRDRRAVPTGEILSEGDVFASAPQDGNAVVRSFRALSTACVPMVVRFLRTAQRSSEGRMDTAFFELAELVRVRLKRISLAVFLITAAVVAAWLARPEVAEQPFDWHLRRALVPVRLVVCLLPLAPTILLQITDVWGNARIQSLFEWHAGNADDERAPGDGAPPEEVSPGSGEIDASRVPLQRQLRELLDILRQGLDGPSNLMHMLNSTTVVCFCDKEGLLTDTCTTIAEVCICKSERRRQEETIGDANEQDAGTASSKHAAFEGEDGTDGHGGDRIVEAAEQALGDSNAASKRSLQIVVLDVQPEPSAKCGLRFEDSDWRQLLPMLKPLGLAMAVSRQPRELISSDDGSGLHDLSVGDVLHAVHRGGGAAMGDCLCNVSRLVGFKDDVVAAFIDMKFCVDLCRPTPPPALEAPPQVPTLVVQQALPREARSPTRQSGKTVREIMPALMGKPWSSPRESSSGSNSNSAESTAAAALMGHNDRELHPASQNEDATDSGLEASGDYQEFSHKHPSTTNYSRTLMTWFVQDSRHGSLQMFCKAKPKRLLPKCTHYFDGSKVLPLREEDKQTLSRLLLQWKASGLMAIAYAYRPLVTKEEIEVHDKLAAANLFCTEVEPDSECHAVEAGCPSSHTTKNDVAAALEELQREQVLVGMAGVKLRASVQMTSYAEALQGAGVRFQVYCAEGEKRTRTLGTQLGLETGWNCLISLEPSKKEVTNMMGQVVLPSGIAHIRKHTKDVDNVPLLVSLFSKATPWRAQQMIDILQENLECVTCVGSALQPNFETFRQANISVSVLVGAVPRCRRCHGKREPRPGAPGGCDEDLVLPGTVNRAEFQLSADLTSLPCALQARHSYSNGEHRTLGVLFNAIKEARRCVDCILMVLIHYLCGAVELAVIVALQVLFCLPAPLDGVHVLALLLVLLPAVSLALLFNAASPQLMRELPLKKADEKTLAQPSRLMALYAFRSIPTALVVVAAFVYDLHCLFIEQLRDARSGGKSAELVGDCVDFAWHWWISGRWPRCVKVVSRATNAATMDGLPTVGRPGAGDRSLPGDGAEISCTLAHAQQWGAFLFVLYEVTLAFTFLDRYDSLITRGPASNMVLCAIAALALIVSSVVSMVVVSLECGAQWYSMLLPTWDVWAVCVGIWPAVAVLVSECTKRRDRRYHMQLQRTLRVLFNTRLGMWSPK